MSTGCGNAEASRRFRETITLVRCVPVPAPLVSLMPKRDADPVDPGSTIYEEAAEAVKSAGLAYALIGGLAANLYRKTHPARLTRDIDFAVETVDDDGLDGLVTAFTRKGWDLVRVLRDDDGTAFLAQFDKDAAGLRAHVDCMFAGTRFEREAIAGADEDHVARAEHIVVYKLIAGRPHDYDDIDAILADNEVDEAEIRGLAEAWEVADRWSEALLRADRRS